MTLRTHLFLLVFTVTISGVALNVANEQWHASLGQRRIELGAESVMREQVRNISFSLQRFLVTYDLVVFGGISYLADDALVQLEYFEDSLDRLVLPGFATTLPGMVGDRLQSVRESLQNTIVGLHGNNSVSSQNAAQGELAWVVEQVDSLEQRIAYRFGPNRRTLERQKAMGVVAQRTIFFSYMISLCALTIWASRRIARPVDSLAKLAKHSIGTPVDTRVLEAGPKEFREITSSISGLTSSLENVVNERTRALEGQVNEHIKRQAALTRSNYELEKSMNDLKATQLALVTKERLSALGEMVGGISHDFNNVLVPIISYSTILIEEPDLDPVERSALLKVVKTAAEDASRIIERLQAFNRPMELSARTQELDIDELIEDAVAMSKPRWRDLEDLNSGSISVVVEPSGIGAIVGDVPEIRQALINLILNAVDALPYGGDVHISTVKEGKYFIVLTVSDNGIGMSEETVASCQKPFFSTKNERGTGLGLAMVKNLAEAHNGKIEIDSALGEGASIRMWLRVAKVETSGPSKTEPMTGP